MNYRNLSMAVGMLATCFATPGLVRAHEEDATEKMVTVTPLMTQALSDLSGKEAMVLTVEYAPGGYSEKHRHTGSHTFVYVLQGAMVMQVEGGEAVTLGPGETFYENPDDIHTVSKNASDTEPAKFLVFFIKNQGAPVTLPAD